MAVWCVAVIVEVVGGSSMGGPADCWIVGGEARRGESYAFVDDGKRPAGVMMVDCGGSHGAAQVSLVLR